MTGYALVYLPAVLLLAAVVVLLVGWLPRASGAVWVAVALCFVVGWLGSLLELPQWAADLSPFTHVPAVPAVPADDLALGPVLAMLALAAAAVAAGWVGFRRRDIG